MDRVDIEALVDWAYRVQCVDRVVGAVNRRGPSGMRSGTNVMVTVAVLGTKIDRSPAFLADMGATAQDDAFVIHDAVMRLPSEAFGLVVAHAKGGSRPPWHGLDAEVLVADTDKRGRVRVMLGTDRRPVACCLRHRVDPALVEFSRAQYVVWWEALSALAEELRGQLVDSDPLPPAAAREPWLLPPLVYVEDRFGMPLDTAMKI